MDLGSLPTLCGLFKTLELLSSGKMDVNGVRRYQENTIYVILESFTMFHFTAYFIMAHFTNPLLQNETRYFHEHSFSRIFNITLLDHFRSINFDFKRLNKEMC